MSTYRIRRTYTQHEKLLEDFVVMKIRDGEPQMVFDHDANEATIFDSLEDAQEHLLWATKWDEDGDHLEIQVKN